MFGRNFILSLLFQHRLHRLSTVLHPLSLSLSLSSFPITITTFKHCIIALLRVEIASNIRSPNCCYNLHKHRHDLYPNQYRAMFVHDKNCRIAYDHILRQKGNSGREEVFYSVRCSNCDTEVGVLDEEEVFHFFNVVPSQA
jgi:hypothetical protein